MKQRQLSVCAGLLLALFSGCAVDERPLSFEYHTVHSTGGTDSGGGDAAEAGDSSPSDDGGDLGASGRTMHAGGESGSPANPPSDDAGSKPMTSAGGTASAGSSGRAGLGGDNGGTSGAATNAGASGGAGAPNPFPCGDLNLDRVDDCTQTLVQNSRFDTSAEQWSAEDSMSQGWDPSNASGKPGSGSLKLSNTSPVNDAAGPVMVGSRQCIRVAAATSYDFALRVMLLGNVNPGEAGINVWFFDDDSCQGNFIAAASPVHGGSVRTWSALSDKVFSPAGAHSMYVRLVVSKPFSEPPLGALVDDILVAKR